MVSCEENICVKNTFVDFLTLYGHFDISATISSPRLFFKFVWSCFMRENINSELAAHHQTTMFLQGRNANFKIYSETMTTTFQSLYLRNLKNEQ